MTCGDRYVYAATYHPAASARRTEHFGEMYAGLREVWLEDPNLARWHERMHERSYGRAPTHDHRAPPTVNTEDLFTALAALRRAMEKEGHDGLLGNAIYFTEHSITRRHGAVSAGCLDRYTEWTWGWCAQCLQIAYLGLIGAIAPAQVVKV